MVVILAEPLRGALSAVPEDAANRLVHRQLYETLVRLDCGEQFRPGLALRWEPDPTALSWTFHLRRGSRFADGLPIDAAAVRRGWERQRTGDTWPWQLIRDVTILDSLTLTVRLERAEPDAPMLFADPALAVVGARLSAGHSAESAGFRIVFTDSTPIGLRPTLAPRSPGAGPVIRIEPLPPGADPRDVLDRPAGGVDLMVSRDPAALDYARGRDDLRTVPLPWDRTYVLLTPSSTPLIPVPSTPARQMLARDAVPGDARGAEPPFWWESDSTLCVGAGFIRPERLREIAFERDDVVARALAERIVALAGSGSAGALRVRPLDRAALDSALAAAGGRDESRPYTIAGFVVHLPRLRPASCAGVPLRPTGFTTVPLVETRGHAIVRRGAPSFTVDGDGVIRVLPRSP